MMTQQQWWVGCGWVHCGIPSAACVKALGDVNG